MPAPIKGDRIRLYLGGMRGMPLKSFPEGQMFSWFFDCERLLSPGESVGIFPSHVINFIEVGSVGISVDVVPGAPDQRRGNPSKGESTGGTS